MSRARYELYAYALEVVVRIVESLNLEFATIAGASIDMANAESAAQDVPQILLQSFDFRRIGGWSWIALRQYPRPYHAQ
jgi:hypothetical protein